jgi:hypothetical protein
MVYHHIQQVKRLKLISGNPCLGLFRTVDDIRLQPEFLRKNLDDNAAFAVIGSFKYDAAGFMKHA